MKQVSAYNPRFFKYKQTLTLKDEEVEFLRGHISQLSEKITPALPPGQEEAKAKALVAVLALRINA